MEENIVLTRDEILSADDLPKELVEVPEWKEGGKVYVSTMCGFVRDKFESSIVGKGGGQNLQNIRAKVAAATIVDANGNLLFSEQDVNKLGKKSAAALDRVFSVAQRLNRLSDADVEELAKNS